MSCFSGGWLRSEVGVGADPTCAGSFASMGFFHPLSHFETLPLSSSSFFNPSLKFLAVKNHTLATFNNVDEDNICVP